MHTQQLLLFLTLPMFVACAGAAGAAAAAARAAICRVFVGILCLVLLPQRSLYRDSESIRRSLMEHLQQQQAAAGSGNSPPPPQASTGAGATPAEFSNHVFI
jgi:hypothetical protein